MNKEMRKAYYARPISIDGTPQEKRDHDTIIALGYQPYPVGWEKDVALELYRRDGMVAFKPYVEKSHILVFRAFTDGSIGSGVAKEIAWAIEAGIPVVELPRQIRRRSLTKEETRDMLLELGQR